MKQSTSVRTSYSPIVKMEKKLRQYRGTHLNGEMAPLVYRVHYSWTLAAEEELAVVRTLEADSTLGIRTSFHNVLNG